VGKKIHWRQLLFYSKKKIFDVYKTLLLDRSLEIDNNVTEMAIKPFVIGRKNWLFNNTSKGHNIKYY